MAVVEGDDEGLPGEPRDRLARARGQKVRERYHVVTGSQRGKLGVRACRVELVIGDDRHLVALP